MKKTWILPAAVLAGLATIAVAQPRMRGMHDMGGSHGMHGMAMRHGGPGMFGDEDGRHLDWLAERLDLTAAQKDAASKLHQGVRDQVETIFDQQRAIHQAIDDMLDAANPDPTALGEKMIEGRALRVKLEGIHDQMMTDFRALLNADQQKKLDEMHEGGMRMRHGGPCEGPPED